MNDGIVIYGFGQSRHRRILNKGECVWTLNDYWLYPQEFQFVKFPIKPSVVFQIHDDFGDNPKRLEEWGGKYNESGAEIITRKKWGLNNETVFDVDRGIKEFGAAFFASGLCYALALAYWRGIKKITLLGIDLQHPNEKKYQFARTYKAIEKIKQMGVQIENSNEAWFKERAAQIDWDKLEEVKILYGDKNGSHKWH